MQRQQPLHRCHFCTKKVDIRKSIDYETGDMTFYFCSKACLKKFKRAISKITLRE